MDLTKLELMRIPFATVLFIASAFLLLDSHTVLKPDSIIGTLGAFVCIGMLVYSIVLYSNLDMPLYKH